MKKAIVWRTMWRMARYVVLLEMNASTAILVPMVHVSLMVTNQRRQNAVTTTAMCVILKIIVMG
jgi:hypothetical protein